MWSWAWSEHAASYWRLCSCDSSSSGGPHTVGKFVPAPSSQRSNVTMSNSCLTMRLVGAASSSSSCSTTYSSPWASASLCHSCVYERSGTRNSWRSRRGSTGTRPICSVTRALSSSSPDCLFEPANERPEAGVSDQIINNRWSWI